VAARRMARRRTLLPKRRRRRCGRSNVPCAPRMRPVFVFFAIVQRFVFAVVRFVWCRACFVLPIYWLCCDNFLSVAVRFQPVLLPFVLFLCGVFQLVPLCATTVYAHPPFACCTFGDWLVPFCVYRCLLERCGAGCTHTPSTFFFARAVSFVSGCLPVCPCSGAIFVNRSVVANRCHCPP